MNGRRDDKPVCGLEFVRKLVNAVVVHASARFAASAAARAAVNGISADGYDLTFDALLIENFPHLLERYARV